MCSVPHRTSCTHAKREHASRCTAVMPACHSRTVRATQNILACTPSPRALTCCLLPLSVVPCTLVLCVRRRRSRTCPLNPTTPSSPSTATPTTTSPHAGWTTPTRWVAAAGWCCGAVWVSGVLVGRGASVQDDGGGQGRQLWWLWAMLGLSGLGATCCMLMIELHVCPVRTAVQLDGD